MGNNDTKIIQLDDEIDVHEKEKGKYTLITQSPVSKEQILRIFQKTPAQHVHKRPGKGGAEWDYVTGVYVKKVLNYVFGWLWDFQIIDKGTVGAQVWVQGRLTIRNPKTLEPLIAKEQFGGADIKFKKGTKAPLDYANDLKAAATDALKKCASELGIAPDFYGKNEFKEMGAKATPLVPPKAPEPPVKDTGYDCHECGALITKAEADYSKKSLRNRSAVSARQTPKNDEDRDALQERI